MNSFYAIQPSPILTPYVKQYWILSLDNAVGGRQRLLPFGSIGITFYRGVNHSRLNGDKFPGAYISGQTSAYSDIAFSGNVDFISIIFEPAGAMLFFDMPMNEITGSHIPVDDLDDKSFAELGNRLAEITDNSDCIRMIENFLLKKLYNADQYRHKRIEHSIKFIHNHVDDALLLAKTACLGYKQFKRVFRENVGINPKEYIRINRFRDAAHMFQVNPHLTLEDLAEKNSYYDKSHLIRDFKTFSGYTPREYVSLCDPYSPYHAFFRSAFLDSLPNQ